LKSHHGNIDVELEFVGVDGEGVNRPDGRHEYVMLSVGDQTLWNNGRELTHRDIFPWLYERFLENPDKAYVGFFLSYDFLEWTKSLSEDDARLLWTDKGIASRKPKRRGFIQSFPVIIDREWEIDLLAKKRLRLRPHHHVGMRSDPFHCYCGEELDMEISADLSDSIEIDDWDHIPELPKPDKARSEPWMYICDTGPFWQKSFLAVVNPKSWPTPIVTAEEYALLKEGKAGRARIHEEGDTSYYEEMRRYNVLENLVLGRVTSELNRGFLQIGVKIPKQSWFGPGQAASIWLKTTSTRQILPFTRIDIEDRVPSFARDAARKSYYGGWFEQFMHGHIPGITYEYDINSAYPFIISRLPCLHCSDRWTQGEGKPEFNDRNMYLLKVRLKGNDPFIGTMPFRDSHGRILRLARQVGWYWKHEIDAAVNAGIVDEYEVLEWVAYEPCDCPQPLASIAELYKLRLKVGKNTPQGVALKLVYNSVYGKFAQSVGRPLWANSVYASLITAGCRTMILEAIASHPSKTRDVTMVATDGVYFRTPHPELEIDGEKLGKWDVDEKRELTQFMPGLYWDEKVRDVLAEEQATGATAEGLPLKTRGVNVRDLADVITELDERFASAFIRYGDDELYAWPMFDVPVRFDIVSPGQALARNRWDTVGIVHGEEHTPLCGDECKKGRKSISSSPGNKRVADGVYVDHDVLRTPVYRMLHGQEESCPYPKRFGDDPESIEIVNPDGIEFMKWFFRDGGETGE
jgi:hypothetical protein